MDDDDIFDKGTQRSSGATYGCAPLPDYIKVMSNRYGELHVVLCACGSGFVVRASDRQSRMLWLVAKEDPPLHGVIGNAIAEAIAPGGPWHGKARSYAMSAFKSGRE